MDRPETVNTISIMHPHSINNFKVYRKSVYHRIPQHRRNSGDDEYQNVKTFNTLWRAADDKREVFLGMVSNRYKIIQNYELFFTIERALETIFGSLDNIEVHDEWVSNGAVCLRQYIVKSSVRQLDEHDRSRIAFRVVANNSFNGSKSATVLAGAIDFFCTNGTIVGEFDRLLTTHSSSLDTEKLTTFIKNAYDAFGRDFEMNQKLLGISCTRKHALRLLKNLNDTEKFEANIGAALDDNIVHHGWNLWATLSTATWWSSTKNPGWASPTSEATTNNAPLRRLERQKEVRAWTKSNLVPIISNPELVAHDVVEEAMS